MEQRRPAARGTLACMAGAVPSPSQAATETLAALESYQSNVRRLVDSWTDLRLYQAVSHDLEAVRRCCQQLPAFSSAWVALLIAHAELAHGLWDSSRTGSRVTADERQRLLALAEQRVQALHTLCKEFVAPGGR
jgi:hypothetical protein